jgi:hypothetical protein
MVLVALIGNSMAQFYPAQPGYPNANMVANATFNFEQSVQGNGYHMSYIYAKAGATAMKNYAHGSGSLDSEATLTWQHLTEKTRSVNADYNDFYQDCIQFKEDVAMVYAPMRIAVGTGYYAANPLDYSSLLKERTEAKNYLAGTSMIHEIEYAHAIDKELDLVVKDKINYTYDPELLSVGYTQMKVTEDVTDGKVHIGVLQANDQFVGQTLKASNSSPAPRDISDVLSSFDDLTARKYMWKDPAIEIDEDYWGTYHIEKNMTLEVPYHIVCKKDDWLPCCFAGFDDMNPLDKKVFKSATGVFDCTCFKAPTVAQFPRVY